MSASEDHEDLRDLSQAVDLLHRVRDRNQSKGLRHRYRSKRLNEATAIITEIADSIEWGIPPNGCLADKR